MSRDTDIRGLTTNFAYTSDKSAEAREPPFSLIEYIYMKILVRAFVDVARD